MATLLRRLRLKRVSLVDAPANEAARVVLFKSATKKMQPTGAEVHVDELPRCKKCDEEIKKVDKKCSKCGEMMPSEEIEKAADRLKEDAVEEKLKADLDAANTKIEALTNERDALQKQIDTPEEIEKRKLAALPESVRKQLETQAADIQKLRSEKAEAEQIEAVRKDMPQLPGKPEDTGKLLKRVKDAVQAEDFEALSTMLKAASAQIEKGELYREVGKSGDGSPVAEAPLVQINRLVAELVSKSADLKLPDAMAQVMREHPDLYAAYARTVTVGAHADAD